MGTYVEWRLNLEVVMEKVLQHPILVLNRNWQPVNVTTVARALIMLWNAKARIVDPQDYQLYDWQDWSQLIPDLNEPCIQAVRYRIRVPEVMTVPSYGRLPSGSVAFSRRNVFKRDHFTCQYCQRQPGAEELTIDHVIPRAQGGETTWQNCVLACVTCNAKKAARTPAEANMRLRKEPAQPSWKPLYAERGHRVESWSKFISEAYWTGELSR